ncbi:hypothetical protein BDY24DRAFT_195714 [Mrakia frigida]|uniref:uncharacterized protein n=1 Tax=Mrakia frigida TaxID=29902 RepID=UPI003FCBEEA5
MPVAVQVVSSPPVSPTPAPYKPGEYSPEAAYGDFRDQLFKDGWAVVPKAFSEENAKAYASKGHDFLESHNLGYDRNDPLTFQAHLLPTVSRGGLVNLYGVGQEQFAWDVRQEQGIIDVFSKIWGTEELLVSMDAVNLSVPLSQTDPKNAGVFEPWAHTDQSPNRQFFHCIQGIANLAPNGPDDGGLMVLQGSKELFNEVFEKFDHQKGEGWTDIDSYHHTPEMLDWLVNEKGCVWHKVCADAGDLILWDSRTVHYGAPPVGQKARTAVYICYKPAALITPERLALRVECIEKLWTTTHDPILFRVIDEKNTPSDSIRPYPAKPVLSARGRQLAGIDAY